MSAWLRVLAALRLSWLGLVVCVCGFGVFCLLRVPRLCPSCGAACGVGLCGGCRGWGLSPPVPLFFFFSGCGGGCGIRPCRFVTLWCSPLPVPVLGLLVSVPPSPFRLGRVYVSFYLVARHFSGVPACRGCPFLRWAAALVSVSPGLAGWSSGVLLGGPVGVAFGVAWLGGLPASFAVGARLLGCVSVPCPPLFCGGRAFIVGRGFLPPVLFVCSLFCFFSGRGFACSSVCLPWAGALTGPLSVWLTRLLLVLRSAGLCPGPFGRVGHVHAWPGGLSCRVRFWPCWLGGCAGGFVRPWAKGGGVFCVPPPLWRPL